MKLSTTLLATLAAALLLSPAPAETTRPQPADGVYTISAELPATDAFLIFLSTLQEGEDHAQFWKRTEAAFHELMEQDRRRCFTEDLVVTENGHRRIDWHRRADAPDIRYRGYLLRNPAAAEALRDVLVPLNRRGEYWNGPFERFTSCEQFLCVSFTRQGITARPALHAYVLGEFVATGAERSWSWQALEDFFAALPELLMGEKRPVPNDVHEGIGGMRREQGETGHRMVVFYGEQGMPLTEYWEAFARLVKLAGEDWVTYCIGSHTYLSAEEDEARYQQSIYEACGGRPVPEALKPPPASLPKLPRPPVEPEIEL